MGKHSHKRGLFGASGGPVGPAGDGRGDRSGRSRVPSHVAGARPSAAARKRKAADYELSDPRKRRKGALEAAPARLRAERERRRGRAKRIFATAGITMLVLLVMGAVGAFAYAKHIESTMQGTIVKQEKVKAALKKAEPQKPYNVLLLGGDHRPGEERYRTDTMIVARVDPQNKKVWMLSIPRDTRVDIPGHGSAKINQAYYYGGAELAIETVKGHTGLDINHYMELNFRGFEKVVNAMGGVWIDVPSEIDDWKAASHSPGHRAKNIDAGYQLLDGEHALTFVRSRAFVDADFSRMKNQQIFFKALADQIAKKGNVVKLPKIVSAVAPYIATDMSLMEMIRTAQALKDAGSSSVYTETIKGEWRSPYVWTDEENMAELIAAMEEGRSFDGSAEATPAVGSEESTAQPVNASSVNADDIDVAVRNGAGIAGVAKQAASILKARGFNVPEVGNANQNVYDKTLIVYKDNKAAAELVAAGLPPGTKLVESRGMYAFDTDVLVVIGKDWDISKVPVTPVQTN